ncbi:hypothetical protein JKP88DRAFT_351318 [Tribonema minus]|uniref:Uncharacterized protein n=1 Tax=Tribonema minus TaxID=303371 RepID=A0A835YRK9_9STRA|nr:hypothetical protein JKP88DRAFT_351318 [Tribonema minus]
MSPLVNGLPDDRQRSLTAAFAAWASTIKFEVDVTPEGKITFSFGDGIKAQQASDKLLLQQPQQRSEMSQEPPPDSISRVIDIYAKVLEEWKLARDAKELSDNQRRWPVLAEAREFLETQLTADPAKQLAAGKPALAALVKAYMLSLRPYSTWARDVDKRAWGASDDTRVVTAPSPIDLHWMRVIRPQLELKLQEGQALSQVAALREARKVLQDETKQLHKQVQEKELLLLKRKDQHGARLREEVARRREGRVAVALVPPTAALPPAALVQALVLVAAACAPLTACGRVPGDASGSLAHKFTGDGAFFASAGGAARRKHLPLLEEEEQCRVWQGNAEHLAISQLAITSEPRWVTKVVDETGLDRLPPTEFRQLSDPLLHQVIILVEQAQMEMEGPLVYRDKAYLDPWFCEELKMLQRKVYLLYLLLLVHR